jgi:hypothetical protein
MPGELRVDPVPLANGGEGLLGAAGDIPLPPVPFTAMGGDALSTILNARTQAIEAPLIAGMPVTKAEALRTAQNVLAAAGIYERVDQQLADDILKALFGIEGADAAGAGGAAGAAGSAASAAGTAPAAAAPAAGAAQEAGQPGQMMGMPMQMASQAAQIPMQMAGMAAAIPQAIMQGVQSGLQQVSQMAGGMGEKPDAEAKGEQQQAVEAERAEVKPEEKAQPAVPEGAAPGQAGGERAPEAAPLQGPAPEAPQPAKPAPTRPATSDPEIAL